MQFCREYSGVNYIGRKVFIQRSLASPKSDLTITPNGRHEEQKNCE